jgi:hypothetical protein
MRETGHHTSLASKPARIVTVAIAVYAGTATRMMQTGSVLILNSMRKLVQKWKPGRNCPG